MSEETQQPALPASRVATRPGASGAPAQRRRLYQRHLLLLLGVGGAMVAFDLYTSPGMQWAHFLIFPWFLVFILHTIGLASRGYTVGELLIPPRAKAVREVYTTALDYELVRSRQLHDGIRNAAAPLREGDSALADEVVAAADELVSTVERMVTAVRANGEMLDGSTSRQLVEAQQALATLDQLHRDLIRTDVLETPRDDLSLETLRERTQALRALIKE